MKFVYYITYNIFILIGWRFDKLGKNYCTECGEKINESDKFCQNCGTTLNKNDPKEKKVTTNTKSSNKGKKLQKKHAIILGVAVILGLILLISVSGILDNSPSHVKNVKVYMANKRNCFHNYQLVS